MSDATKMPFDAIPLGGTATAEPRPAFSRSAMDMPAVGLLPPTRKPVAVSVPEPPSTPTPNPMAGNPPPKPGAVRGFIWDLVRPTRGKMAVLAGGVSLVAGAYGLNLVVPTPTAAQTKKGTEVAKADPPKVGEERQPPPKVGEERTPAPKPGEVLTVGLWDPAPLPAVGPLPLPDLTPKPKLVEPVPLPPKPVFTDPTPVPLPPPVLEEKSKPIPLPAFPPPVLPPEKITPLPPPVLPDAPKPGGGFVEVPDLTKKPDILPLPDLNKPTPLPVPDPAPVPLPKVDFKPQPAPELPPLGGTVDKPKEELKLPDPKFVIPPPKPVDAVPPPKPAPAPIFIEEKGPVLTPVGGGLKEPPPAALVGGSAAKKGLEVDVVKVRGTDTYAGISESFYQSRKYAAALRAFNGNADIGTLQEVEVPPLFELQKQPAVKEPTPDPRTNPAVKGPVLEGDGGDGLDWGPAGKRRPVVKYEPYTTPKEGMTPRQVAQAVYQDESQWPKLMGPRGARLRADDPLPRGTELTVPREDPWR